MFKRGKSFVLGAVAGAGAAYLMDPERGRGRRAKAIDMVGGRVRRGALKVERKSRYAEGVIAGVQHRLEHPGLAEPEVDDRTLKDRVESMIFGPDLPKANVVIDVVDGVVTLRGQLKRPDQIKAAEAAAASIPGVKGVQNLLHPPGQSAPNKAEAERASREAGAAGGPPTRATG
jgi:osmotically-inducible protein OsmY